MKNNIGIIGLGNIGFSLAKGLSKKKTKNTIYCYDHNEATFQKAKKELKVFEFKSNCIEVIQQSEVILVCIRTNQIEDFLRENILCFTENKIVVFLSAGIKLNNINAILKESNAIIFRAITNINVSSLNGYTFLLSNNCEKETNKVACVFKNLGILEVVNKEEILDIHSIVSGCSPALIAFFYDLLLKSSNNIGLTEQQSKAILNNVILQTINTIDLEKLNPSKFIENVCTKDGLVFNQMTDLIIDNDFKNKIINWLPQIAKKLT